MTDDQKRCLMLRVACLSLQQWQQCMKQLLYQAAGKAGLGEPLVDAMFDYENKGYVYRESENVHVEHFDGMIRIYLRVDTDLKVIAATEKIFNTLCGLDSRRTRFAKIIPWDNIGSWCDFAIREWPVRLPGMPMVAEL